MNRLADLLDAHGAEILDEWIQRLAKLPGVPPTSETGLRDHVPDLLQELAASLRAGTVASEITSARAHGLQRKGLGFDLELLVREYGLLRDVIFDVTERRDMALPLREIRIITGLFTQATAHGVDAYVQRERANVESLFMQAPVAIALLDGPEYRFRLANTAYRALVGGADIVGRALGEVVPEEQRREFTELFDRVVASGETVVERSVGVRAARGEELVLDLTLTPRRNSRGRIEGVLVVGVEVTEAVRERAELELLASTTRAQQAQLTEVLDALPVLVSFVTAEERYALVNTAYEGWFGLNREQLVGRTILEIIGDAAYARLGPFVHRALAGEQFDFEQHDVPYRHGGTRDVRVSFIPRHDAEGNVSGYVALLNDITAARRHAEERERLLGAEREAHARTEFLLGVASALGEGLHANVVLQRLVEVIVPTRGNFASVWWRGDGGRLRRHVHAPFHASLMSDASLHDPPPAIARAAETAEPVLIPDFDAWAGSEREEGARALARTTGTRAALFVPIRSGNEVVAVLAVSRAEVDSFSKADIELFETTSRLTAIALENARLYEETERLRAAAEAATAEKDRFLAHVSHDLRNPLGSILGWSALLRDAPTPAQVERGIGVIERNAKAQVQLIDDLLDMSRIATGKLTLSLSVEDVRIAVDTALDPARLTAQAKGVTLTAEVTDDVGLATIDPDRFRQVIWNLVSNAVKFTPAGGRVHVAVTRDRSTIRVVVADTGRGIAPEFLSRVFNRFEQASSDSQRSGGLGLGLAIVRHLVELHGGTIGVESVLGDGATFTAIFPAPSVGRTGIESSVAKGHLEGVRVLVVDDQEDLRDLTGALLEVAGATVETAASADEAMAMFLRRRPDFLVSDIGMPIKDGRSLVRDIRSLPEERGGRVPALALTAFGQARDRALALEAGFDELLMKPIEGTHLIATIVRMLGAGP